MTEAPAPTGNSGGFLNRPIRNQNNVPQLIKDFQASKATGKFTFRAGRMDRVINLAIGIGMCFVMANVGHGAYQLANGIGRKEGF